VIHIRDGEKPCVRFPGIEDEGLELQLEEGPELAEPRYQFCKPPKAV
jgi:hypothetical protein